MVEKNHPVKPVTLVFFVTIVFASAVRTSVLQPPAPQEARPIPYSQTSDRDGEGATGSIRMIFSLYGDQTGRAPLWSEIHQVDVYNSVFQVLPGSTSLEKAGNPVLSHNTKITGQRQSLPLQLSPWLSVYTLGSTDLLTALNRPTRTKTGSKSTVPVISAPANWLLAWDWIVSNEGVICFSAPSNFERSLC